MLLKPKLILSDFDGTLTHGHEVRPNFFSILDESKRLNIPFIIVTGRSLSWGHFLLTHFHFKYIIVEGGGLLIESKGPEEMIEHLQISSEELEILKEKTDLLLKTFKGLKLSVDSYGRKTDRAIAHFASETQKQEVQEFLKKEGLHFNISNVHLNFWKGDFSKYACIQYLLKTFFSHVSEDEVLFFGDSTNDQSVFKGLNHTVGVANIQKFLPLMQHHPKMILQGEAHNSADGVLSYLRSLK